MPLKADRRYPHRDRVPSATGGSGSQGDESGGTGLKGSRPGIRLKRSVGVPRASGLCEVLVRRRRRNSKGKEIALLATPNV